MKNKWLHLGSALMIAAALALLPLTAQATAYTWSTGITGTLGTWDTVADWTPTPVAGGPAGTGNTAAINNTTATTVNLNTAIASLGGLTIGSADTLQINTGGSLKSNSITLNGGSLTGNGGTLTSPTPISGYGTVSTLAGAPSSLTGLGTLTANNATYGNAININNITQTGAVTLGFGSKGTFNLSNVTLGATSNTGTILTFSGSTTYSQFTNPLPGTFGNNWGNVNYGLANVTGDTTLNGHISLANYYVFNITNSTLTVNNPGTITGFNTSSPPVFVLGTGGNLNLTGDTTLGTSAPIPINGGALTHTGGAFNAYAFIGYGSISGVTSLAGGGNVLASGGTAITPQTLTFDVGSGASLGSHSGAGATLSSSANNTLDLKGTYNYLNPGIIAPNGGTVALDGATLNSYDATTTPNPTTWNVTLNPGAVNVINDSAMIGKFTSSATIGVNSGKTLTLNAGALNGGSLTNTGTLAVGAGTLNNNSANAYILGGGGNLTLAGGTIQSIIPGSPPTPGGGFTSNNAFSGYGNLTTLFTNNGSMNITGGILNVTGNGQIAGTGNVTITDPVVTTGLNLQSNKLLANNFSMGANTTLTVAGASTPLVLTGNFSFGQTDPLNWTYGATTGLGPDLKMEGTGTVLNPQTLEVGGVYKGTNTLDGKNNNFALNSLTLGAGAYVKLVDFISNAGTAGSEVLYLGALLSGGDPPTLDLNGIMCFVQDGNGFDQLYNGETYQGINIVPIPPSAMLLGTGLLGLVGLGWRRRKVSQA